MKKIVLLFGSILLSGCQNSTDIVPVEKYDVFKAQKSQKIARLSVSEFANLAKSGDYQVIDIRTPGETTQGKIYLDALEIDFYAENFTENIKKLDRDKKYLIYCRSGSRTGQTLALMQKLGFQTVSDLEKGKVAWDLR